MDYQEYNQGINQEPNDEDIDQEPDEEYDEDIAQEYQELLVALTPYVEINGVPFPDDCYFEPDPNMPDIVGYLKQDFMGLSRGTNVYMIFYYEDGFVIRIKSISNEDLQAFIESNTDDYWYEMIFVPGKGFRKCSYDIEEGTFTLLCTSNLPGRSYLESILEIEPIQIDIHVKHPDVNKTDDEVHNNDFALIYPQKEYFQEYLTLGKLKQNFLKIPPGINVLIHWHKDFIPNIDDEHEIIVYAISDRDINNFKNSQSEHEWYQDIYVPGKKYLKYTYSCLTNSFKLEERMGIFELFTGSYSLSDSYASTRYNGPVPPRSPVYKGITLREFGPVPKHYLLIMYTTETVGTYLYLYAPMSYWKEFGLDWSNKEICILEKRAMRVHLTVTQGIINGSE